jgi:hypothetical protein
MREERLGMMCGYKTPTAEQITLAERIADEYVKAIDAAARAQQVGICSRNGPTGPKVSKLGTPQRGHQGAFVVALPTTLRAGPKMLASCQV